MEYLIILLVLMASVATPITLQYNSYEQGDPYDAIFGNGYAVWFDLDSLGYSSFDADSVEIAFVRWDIWYQWPFFHIELWQDTGNHFEPEILLWESFTQTAVGSGPPCLQRFPVDYEEILSDHIWVVIRGLGSTNAPWVVAQDAVYRHSRFWDGGYWSQPRKAYTIRLIGEDASILEQGTWAAIKTSF